MYNSIKAEDYANDNSITEDAMLSSHSDINFT